MQNITRIAAALKETTKTSARAALKAAGIKQSLAEELLKEKGRIDALRDKKRAARRQMRQGNGRKPVRLPSGTPAERLASARMAAVVAVFNRTYRKSTYGTDSVVLTKDPAKVGVEQDTRKSWEIYSRSCTWPARVQDTTLTVPADWRVRVQRRGLETVDGMMTLDAAPIEGAPQGVALFAATWLVQGRGTTVTAVRGYIAVSGSNAYHAESAEKALAGLRRKIKAAEWEVRLKTADLSALLGQAKPGAMVCVADAKAVGACEYGIKSWCYANDIDYAAGCAPLADVYAAYTKEPRTEARAAILHALRRQRVRHAT